MNNDINFTSVDTLGSLLAQIADLTKQADSIKDSIKESASAGGAKVVEGALCDDPPNETAVAMFIDSLTFFFLIQSLSRQLVVKPA